MAKRRRNLLDAVLADSTSAVCVLDGDRRIRFFSPGMEQLTGWKPSEVEGLTCTRGIANSGAEVDLLTASLLPAMPVLEGAVETLNTVLPRRNGTSVKAQLTFVPVLDDGGSVVRIVVHCDARPRQQTTTASLSQQLHAEVTALRIEFRRRFAAESFIGRCPEIRRALEQAELLRGGAAGYTITGPPGSGRRHFARMVHATGAHSEQSFVPLDCRMLTAEQVLLALRNLRQLAEQESAPHKQTGTLLFVDAHLCPREVQSWVLDNLSEQLQQARLVATTETDLQQVVADGWMLPRFHQLLDAVLVRLPPLHQRGDDIPLLAQHFIMEAHRHQQTSAESLAPDVLQEFRFYRWPGNVRELQSVVMQACENSFDTQLQLEDIPFAFKAGLEAQSMPPTPTVSEQSLDAILRQFETDVLRQTLDACDGNKAEAARRLGLTRPKLYRRLETLNLSDPPDHSEDDALP